jgi:hypothetical protein
MIQLLYAIDFGTVTPRIQVAAAEGAREANEIFGGDNLSLVPLMEWRLGATVAKMVTFGVSGVYGVFDSEGDLSAAGFSADLNAAPHKLFSLMGEFGFGTNLNNANIFTIGASGTADRAVENIGFWVNIISKPLDFLNVVAGIGNEYIFSDVADGARENNFTVYGDLIFPIGKYFSLAGEYQYIQTTYKGSNARGASVVDIAGKLVF